VVDKNNSFVAILDVVSYWATRIMYKQKTRYSEARRC